MEGADLGVKVTVVCPGAIQTNIFDSAKVLKMKNDDFFGLMKFKLKTAEKAASVILKKTAKNKNIIAITPTTHILWRLNRLSPALTDNMMRLPQKFIRNTIRQN